MIMRTEVIKNYIRKREELFWYSPRDKGETVSDELLVETILNYGTMDDIQELFSVMGIKKVAFVFRGMFGRKKLNFYPEIYNYFNLYFDKYAS